MPTPAMNRVRALPACVAVAAVLCIAPSARAYCRTTTTAPAAGYDPLTDGCWTQGSPIAWPTAQPVGYELDSDASSQIDFASFSAVASQAFETWNAVVCPSGPLALQTYYQGAVDAALVSTDCGLVTCGDTVHDTHHVITFRDASWPHNDIYNTLALTTVTYGVNSGNIYDADTEINSAQHQLTTQEPPPTGEFDLQSILVHEAGHFLGLAHTPDQSAVMYAYYNADSTLLTTDDTDGICAAYKPGPAQGSGCAFAAQARSSGSAGTLAVGALAALALAFGRARRGPRGRGGGGMRGSGTAA